MPGGRRRLGACRANQDAFAESGKLGMDPAMAVGFAADADGIRRAYSSSSKAVRDYRKRGWIGLDWKRDVN